MQDGALSYTLTTMITDVCKHKNPINNLQLQQNVFTFLFHINKTQNYYIYYTEPAFGCKKMKTSGVMNFWEIRDGGD